MSFKAIFRGAAFAGVCACLTWTPVAQAQSNGPTEADLDRVFQQVLADPTNLDLAFEYARIATALGDFEAAISSLERMLIYNPDLPRVQLELGVLYFRLGSYGAAKSYFDQALAAPDMPDAAKERVNQYLAQIERATSRHSLAYGISGGVRYQTNANSAPGSTVLFAGIPVQLDPEFQKEEDFNLFVSANVRHRYDFGGQNGDFMETNAGVYLTHQFSVDDLDIVYGEVNSGPVIHVDPGSGMTVRPYVTGSYLMLSEDPYQAALGGGARLNIPLNTQLTLGLDSYARYADYRSSDVRPNADDLDARELSAEAELIFQPFDYIQLSGGLQGRIVDARADFQAYNEFGLRVAATLSVPAPVNLTGTPSNWTILLDTRGLTRYYDAPNPIISAETREEHEVRADAQLYVPVSNNISLFSGVGWRDVSSNISNYDVENLTVMGGVSGRF